MKKLISAFPISAALATAFMLSTTAQADVSDFASSSSQTTDRTSADEMESDSDQYYSGSTDASESYSGAIGGSSESNRSTLSRRAVPITDFSGYRTLGSRSIVDNDQTGSAFGQSTNQVPNPTIDTGASAGLGYGINQGSFTPNGGLSSPAVPTTSGSSAGSSSTATISAP